MSTDNNNECILLKRYKYIPVDFVKFEVINIDKNQLINNENLIFNPVYKDAYLHYYIAQYINLKIKIYNSGRIFFSGSLHKFWNNGKHNHNMFHENALNQVISTLNKLFSLTPENFKILCIEYGVNIYPPIKTKQILNHLFEHKKKDFETKISNNSGHYLQVEHEEYIIKVYDKSKQYNLDEDILRIEIKQRKNRRYKLQGIKTFKDFLLSNKLIYVEFLIKKWDEIIFYNPLNKLPEKWHKYNNINYWREIRSISNKNHSKHRNKLKELNKEFSELDVQAEIQKLILKNLNNLQGVTNSPFNESIKKCKLTGIDISIQRKDSFLLSHKGLYQLFKTNKNEFVRLKKIFLSDKWIDEDLTIQIREIAHNIRTDYSNKIKRYTENQLQLF